MPISTGFAEAPNRHAFHLGVDPEQAASVGEAAQVAIVGGDPGGGDKELVAVGAAKAAGGDVFGWYGNGVHQGAAGRIPQ